MRSFSYMTSNNIDVDLCYEINQSLKELRLYFAKCNPYKVDEAIEMSFFHALSHYNRDEGELKPYLKSLARSILKTNLSRREHCFEFMEDVVKDTDMDVATGVVDDAVRIKVENRVVNLALTFMNFFVLLSESIIQHDSETRYYSKEFKDECLRLVRSYDDFNSVCLHVYNSYGTSMKSFLSTCAGVTRDVWKEADYGRIRTSTSKRVKLLDSNLQPVTDLDGADWGIYGSLGSKRVVKVSYTDAWDTMCSLISEESGYNPMRFNIMGHFIIRTLGGSWSVVNPNINYYYELTLDEIVTNIIRVTCGKYLGRGIENLYLLVDEYKPIASIKMCGVELSFPSEDITDLVTKVSR